MEILKVEIEPTDNREKPQIKVLCRDDNGNHIIDATSGLIVINLDETSRYITIQGNIVDIIGFFVEQFLDKETFMFQTFLTSMATAIKSANQKQLLDLYNVSTSLLDLCANRQQEIDGR